MALFRVVSVCPVSKRVIIQVLKLKRVGFNKMNFHYICLIETHFPMKNFSRRLGRNHFSVAFRLRVKTSFCANHSDAS